MPETVVDFSVNLNPFGPPSAIKRQWNSWFPAIMDYPDPAGRQLVQCIAEKEELPESSILLGNGGAEIIALLAKRFSGKKVLIIQPTFSEYERTCQAYGCQVCHFILSEPSWQLPLDQIRPQLANVDVLFFCHPNNPTGVCYSRNELTELVRMCADEQCYLVIDEAFYDFQSQPESMASLIEAYPYLIILRSLTKMYAMAGLRLGYMLASPAMVKQLTPYQPHWNINAIALLAGVECIRAETYVQQTQDFVKHERQRIVTSLREAGYRISDSWVNFYLLRDPDLDTQLSLFRFLLKLGLVPRHTANYHGLNGRWMRFSIKTSKQNNRLLEALLAWKNTN